MTNWDYLLIGMSGRWRNRLSVASLYHLLTDQGLSNSIILIILPIRLT